MRWSVTGMYGGSHEPCCRTRKGPISIAKAVGARCTRVSCWDGVSPNAYSLHLIARLEPLGRRIWGYGILRCWASPPILVSASGAPFGWILQWTTLLGRERGSAPPFIQGLAHPRVERINPAQVFRAQHATPIASRHQSSLGGSVARVRRSVLIAGGAVAALVLATGVEGLLPTTSSASIHGRGVLVPTVAPWVNGFLSELPGERVTRVSVLADGTVMAFTGTLQVAGNNGLLTISSRTLTGSSWSSPVTVVTRTLTSGFDTMMIEVAQSIGGDLVLAWSLYSSGEVDPTHVVGSAVRTSSGWQQNSDIQADALIDGLYWPANQSPLLVVEAAHPTWYGAYFTQDIYRLAGSSWARHSPTDLEDPGYQVAIAKSGDGIATWSLDDGHRYYSRYGAGEWGPAGEIPDVPWSFAESVWVQPMAVTPPVTITHSTFPQGGDQWSMEVYETTGVRKEVTPWPADASDVRLLADGVDQIAATWVNGDTAQLEASIWKHGSGWSTPGTVCGDCDQARGATFALDGRYLLLYLGGREWTIGSTGAWKTLSGPSLGDEFYDEGTENLLPGPQGKVVAVGSPSDGLPVFVTQVSEQTATTPGAPTSVQAKYAGKKARTATVSWTRPTSDGGSPVTSYQYRSMARSGTWTAWTTTAKSSCRISRLVQGMTYTFEVRALNTIGQGPSTTYTLRP